MPSVILSWTTDNVTGNLRWTNDNVVGDLIWTIDNVFGNSLEGGHFSDLQCARYQLWVTLVEKAAAKLFGCYGALASGTMMEALQMLTGSSTERLQLCIPAAALQRREAIRQEQIQRRTHKIMRGESVCHWIHPPTISCTHLLNQK